MGRKSLITLFLVAFAFVCLHLFFKAALKSNLIIYQLVSILYLWAPGIIALIFARKEDIKIPVFAKANRFFWEIPIVTLGICLFGFLVSIPFGAAKTPNPVFADQSTLTNVGYGILFLFTSYVLATLFFGVIFFGGELFYRGYLWQKWKRRGALKAIYLTALVWSLYQLPITIFAYSPGFQNLLFNVLWTFVLNFILSPILAYYRVEGKSVLAATFFYSSLVAAFLYFLVLFPISEIPVLAGYAGFTLVGLIFYSFFRKIYSPSSWETRK